MLLFGSAFLVCVSFSGCLQSDNALRLLPPGDCSILLTCLGRQGCHAVCFTACRDGKGPLSFSLFLSAPNIHPLLYVFVITCRWVCLCELGYQITQEGINSQETMIKYIHLVFVVDCICSQRLRLTTQSCQCGVKGARSRQGRLMHQSNAGYLPIPSTDHIPALSFSHVYIVFLTMESFLCTVR